MIDGGLGRAGRSADRQPVYRAEAVQGKPEPQSRGPVSSPKPEPPVRSTKPRTPRGGRGFIVGLIALIVAILVAFAVAYLFIFSSTSRFSQEIDSTKYQAVFLSSGQVYFGKLSTVGSDYLKLSDVFYIQTNNSTSEGASEEGEIPDTSAGMQLIKLGQEVHGPESAMVINADQVLFVENLKSDSDVVRLIDSQKKNSK